MAKVPGSIWVEGDDLHWVDQFGREWYTTAIGVKAVAGRPGSIWIDPNNQYLMYMNERGDVACTPNIPWGDALAPINARFGSIWIGQDNQVHYIGIQYDANYRYNVRIHNDQAVVNNHTDAHQDSPHVDSAHVDGAHTDVPSTATHTDWHIDDPHHDFTDNWHNDQAYNPYQNFQDFSDQIYYYHPQYQHTDAPGGGYRVHGDYRSGGGTFHEDYTHTDYGMNTAPENSQHDDFWNHTDVPHGDIPHIDQHGDSGHQDEATENFHGDHYDSTAHQDVAHVDVAHGDGHTDAHQDSHGDTPHVDAPYLIGY